MKSFFIKVFTIFLITSILASIDVFSKLPVVLLLKSKGMVEYSRDDLKWEKIIKNKFLYENYYVRTSKDGLCKLLLHETSKVRDMYSNTKIKVESNKIKLISGNLSESKFTDAISESLHKKYSSIDKKYSKIVRFSPSKKRVRLYTAENIVLSDDFPYFVWENVGSEYTYRLIIGKKSIDVPGSPRDLIRFKVPQLPSGQYKYKIQVINSKRDIVYDPLEMNSIRWMSIEETITIKEKINSIKTIFNSHFLLGDYMDEQGLKVNAMDIYHNFFLDNPYNYEMMPFLIKVYDDLKLCKLRSGLLSIYNAYKYK